MRRGEGAQQVDVDLTHLAALDADEAGLRRGVGGVGGVELGPLGRSVGGCVVRRTAKLIRGTGPDYSSNDAVEADTTG